MSKHTPGPWQAGRADMATVEYGVDSKWIYADKKYIALASGNDVDTWDEVMANAHLIAAAPELLEACKKALSYITVQSAGGELPPIVGELNNILAKAESGGLP